MEYFKRSFIIFSLKKLLQKKLAAIIIEPVQGEGGFLPVPLEYVKELRKICDEHGILLICDEVQSGYCRTGKMFACEYWAEEGIYPVYCY